MLVSIYTTITHWSMTAHYSAISSVSANWGLSTLGRYDVGAGVFEVVAKHTGDRAVKPERDLSTVYLNESYPGILNREHWAPQPAPNVSSIVNGRPVSEKIQKAWNTRDFTIYHGQHVVPDKQFPPMYRRSEEYESCLLTYLMQVAFY